MRTHATKNLLIAFLAATAIASATPTLRLSSAAVATVNIPVGANGPAQKVEAYNIGDGTLNLSVTTSAPWLSASVGASTACTTRTGTCFPINITLNTSALAAGTYTEFVTATDPSAVDSPQSISVSISVAGVPNSIELYAGTNGGQTSVDFLTHGAVTAAASVASGGPWLTVSVDAQGSFAAYVPYKVAVTTQPGQGVGNYSGSIVVSGSNFAGDNKTVPVTLHVTDQPIAVLTPARISLQVGQGGKTSQAVTIGNSGQGALTVSGATAVTASGGTWLSVSTTAGGGTLTASVDATSLQPGNYQGTVTVSTNAANNSQLVIPVNVSVNTSSAPLLNYLGVVDAAISNLTIAQGGIASAYGVQLFTGSPQFAGSTPLPVALGGIQIAVNGVAAPIFYASSGQINFQVPWETPVGTATIQVTRDGQPGNLVSATIAARAPTIILLSPPYNGAPAIFNQDGSIPTSITLPSSLTAKAAKAGDFLVIYALGLGQTSPVSLTGVAGPSAEPLARVYPTVPVTVMLGGGFQPTSVITPAYAGMSPNFVGLYQVNFQIPTGTATGTLVNLAVTVPGGVSNTVHISISQ